MTENAPEADPAQDQPQSNQTDDQPKADETDWKAEARKWETRAKTNADAAKRVAEFEKERKASMTEAERAVAEAESRGRTAAVTEFGKELAQTQFDAVAGRRNPDFDTAKALEFVDLTKFLGEDGRPDSKAIAAAVERLVPEPASGPPAFDGGTRTAPPAGGDMNSLLRKAAGRA